MEPRQSRANVHRLLHALVPFLIMISIERGIVWEAARWSPTHGTLFSMIAFLLSSGAAVLFFRLYRSPAPTEEDVAPVGELKRAPGVVCAADLVLALALLVAWMYAAGALTGGFEGEPAGWKADGVKLVSLLVLHPLIEEYVFRRMFYGELRLMSPIFGVLAQAVMFAIAHSGSGDMIYALGAGMILGTLYERTGSFWSVTAAHLLVNLRSAAYLAHPALSGDDELRLRIDCILFALGLAAAAAVVFLRGRRTENTPDEGDAPSTPDGGDA